MSTIRVDIEYQGTEQGAAQIGRLQQNLTAADAAQQATTRSATQLGAATTSLGQQTGRLTSALGQAGQVLGRLSPEAGRAAGLLTQMGGATTALTGSMGPLGVVLGAVTIGVGVYAEAQRRAQEESDATRESIDRLSASYATLRTRLISASQAREQDARLARGEGSREDFEAEAQRFENRARQIELTLRALAQNDDLGREERAARTRMLSAQRGAAQRRAAFARERIAEGDERGFVIDVEGTGSGAGFGVDLPPTTPRGGGRRERTQTFAQQEAAAWREASDARRLYEELLEEGIAQEEALALQQASIDTQIHENRISAREREQEQIAAFYDYQRQREQEALDKAKEAARERSRANQAIGAEAAGIAKQVGSAYFDAFMLAVEGTLSLEDAMLAATKQVLRSIGEELVARGIGKILEGIAEIPSPTAATKIGGGVAMVGFGIGLGAASAAIPTPESKGAEQPRPEQDRGEDRGPGEVTIVFGNPVLTAGTQAQLARGMGRALKGDRTLPRSVG